LGTFGTLAMEFVDLTLQGDVSVRDLLNVDDFVVEGELCSSAVASEPTRRFRFGGEATKRPLTDLAAAVKLTIAQS